MSDRSIENGVTPVLRAVATRPERAALVFPGEKVLSFADVEKQATRYQSRLKSLGLTKGDVVLLGAAPEPRIFGFVLAALGLGIAVAVIEPWMPLQKINSVVEGLRPKLFLTGLPGRLWGLRVAGIRAIPKWMSLDALDNASSPSGQPSFEAVSVDANTLGLVAFTSGTTGQPKGVPRRHGYLLEQHRVLSETLHHDQHERPELTIFTNFVFANLASGRGSVVIPSKWSDRDIRWASSLSEKMSPETATIGPAFLKRISTQTGFEGLRAIHVGGALTDCAIFESAFGRFKDCEFLHVYGSSEAEPVATMNAREAVDRSRAQGFFQTLALGRPATAIEARIETDTMWVTGPHVCPFYVGKKDDVEKENRLNKQMDERGRIWHSMGDRIHVRDGIWWYGGRSSQRGDDFQLEQKISQHLETSKIFCARSDRGALRIYIDGSDSLRQKAVTYLKTGDIGFNGDFEIFSTEIVRDHRHRARIDRTKSILKAKREVLS